MRLALSVVASAALAQCRAMSMWSRVAREGPSGFGYRSTAAEVTEGCELSGKRYLLTGCNSGIGFETLAALTAHGATVLAAARTLDKARAACERVSGDTIPLECELSEPTSVREAVSAAGEGLLDGILCNAGVMLPHGLHTKHGYELQFLTNHIGHFILVNGLLPRLSQDARVVCVSSGGHRLAPRGGIAFDNLTGERPYLPWQAYGQSKLANLLFVQELARRFAGAEQLALAVHPGVVATQLTRGMSRLSQLGLRLLLPLFVKTPAEGAATSCFALVHRGARAMNGAYLVDCNVAEPSRHARDPVLARRLWRASEEIAARLWTP